MGEEGGANWIQAWARDGWDSLLKWCSGFVAKWAKRCIGGAGCWYEVEGVIADGRVGHGGNASLGTWVFWEDRK